ncbi:MAG: recombinase family protein [Lachnospiraceae bacterium]|nr:recombinase family protein [Lachnospiraceae bacterium]
MIIGYTRPYHDDLQCTKQEQLLKEIHCDKIVIEEHSSSKKRTQLKQLLNLLENGDIIVITRLFSLADSTRHLVELLEIIEEKGAYLTSLEESIDTSSAKGYPFVDIVKHLVRFQSDVVSEKTKNGMYEAKQKGISSGRPKKPDENVSRAIVMYQSKKYSLNEIKEKTGISKSTLYRYLEH